MTSAATIWFTPALRTLTAVLGAGSFGLGTLAVFATQNGAGSAALIVFGGALLLLALLGSRIESLEFGGATLRIRAAAAERFAWAEESERRGDTATAGRLRAEARALLDAAGPIAADYGSVRGSMPAGAARTRAMEEAIARARRLAQEQSFERTEVVRWLREGTDEERITALAMMQANPELRNFEATLAAIARSRTPFEQYHALRLSLHMVDGLDADQARRLAEAVEAQRGIRFRMDSDRRRLGEEILRKARGRSQK
uniref:Secreted protein n=1 Tax=Streptomyces sp. NBC_00049 TaxID=2903617 RepID=A0AAU2JZJ3_9ACTN